ncbi:MAG: hypothetical protein K4304_03350 [Propionicimonas sp.]
MFGAPPVTSAATAPTEPVAALAAAEGVSVKPAATATATLKKKMVFAHYHMQYPISLDNQVASKDYYATQYLSASGEGGKYRNYGAYLRDRPLPQTPVAGSSWELINFQREIAYAKRGGVDGFAINVWPNAVVNGADMRQYYQRAVTLIKAAKTRKFPIMLQPDIGSSGYSANALGDDLAVLARTGGSGVIVRDSKGRVVVSPFAADARSVSFWKAVLTRMGSKGVKAVLLPVFQRSGITAKRFAAWKSISVGAGDWGGRNPRGVWSHADILKKAGKLWMQPVSVQDTRPHGSDKPPNYEEAANSTTLRANWSYALGAKKGRPTADLVLLVTWNDYGETTHFAPSVQHGYSLLDMNLFYVRAYKKGKTSVTPAVVSSVGRERLIVSHRQHSYAFKPKYKYPMAWRRDGGGTKPRNSVEVVTYLKSSAKVVVRIGTAKYTYTAKSGVYVKTFSLRSGSISATFVRSGRSYTATTGTKVTNNRTLQDMGYLFASVAR